MIIFLLRLLKKRNVYSRAALSLPFGVKSSFATSTPLVQLVQYTTDNNVQSRLRGLLVQRAQCIATEASAVQVPFIY